MTYVLSNLRSNAGFHFPEKQSFDRARHGGIAGPRPRDQRRLREGVQQAVACGPRWVESFSCKSRDGLNQEEVLPALNNSRRWPPEIARALGGDRFPMLLTTSAAMTPEQRQRFVEIRSRREHTLSGEHDAAALLGSETLQKPGITWDGVIQSECSAHYELIVANRRSHASRVEFDFYRQNARSLRRWERGSVGNFDRQPDVSRKQRAVLRELARRLRDGVQL